MLHDDDLAAERFLRQRENFSLKWFPETIAIPTAQQAPTAHVTMATTSCWANIVLVGVSPVSESRVAPAI